LSSCFSALANSSQTRDDKSWPELSDEVLDRISWLMIFERSVQVTTLLEMIRHECAMRHRQKTPGHKFDRMVQRTCLSEKNWDQINGKLRQSWISVASVVRESRLQVNRTKIAALEARNGRFPRAACISPYMGDHLFFEHTAVIHLARNPSASGAAIHGLAKLRANDSEGNPENLIPKGGRAIFALAANPGAPSVAGRPVIWHQNGTFGV